MTRTRTNKLVAIFLVVINTLLIAMPVNVDAATSANLSISDNGISFICSREGFHATCYSDYSQSSIGYGTKCTGSSVQPHASGLHTITKEAAMAALKTQVNSTYAPRVRAQTIGIEMNQNQFDALVSLCYNCGGGNTMISNSPLLKYLKGELTESQARSQYSNYIVTANGQKLQGLVNRRNAEADLFFSNSGGTTISKPTWAKLTTQNNRTVFGIGEQVQFKMNSDNAKYYVIGIDYEGERIVTSTMEEGYDLYCYGFNFTGNYTAYVSAYNGDNHIESNVVNFKVVENVNFPTWATLATQNNRTVFGIGEQVQFKMNSDNAKYYVIGIDYEGERIVTSTMAEGYDLYCYGFNFTGNYTAYVSAYNGDNHIESNVINFKVVEKVDAPTWATLTTQDNRDTFEIGEQVQFKMNSDNAKYYVIGIDYEGERIVTSPMAEGYDLYCYGFNFPGNYTAYVSAYNGDNHVESNVINFKVTHSYGEWTTVKSATCISEGQETRICSTCGEKETRSIAKTSHNYVTKVISSTTTEQGYDLHTCSLCGNSYKDNFKELEKLLGDVNADGKFNISDAVILQKWLLAVPNTKLADWKAADLCEDDRLDVFDLCMMKRMLIANS